MDKTVDQQRSEHYAELFATPLGQIVLRDLMSFCGVMSPEGPPTTDLAMAYDKGQRSVAMMILNRTNWDLDAKFVRKQLAESFTDYPTQR